MEAQKPAEIRASRPSSEMDTLPLYRLAYGDEGVDARRKIEAQIELAPADGTSSGLLAARAGRHSARRVLEEGRQVRRVRGHSRHRVPLLHGPDQPDRIGAAGHDSGFRSPSGRPTRSSPWWVSRLMFRLERPGDRDWIGRVRAWMLKRFDSLRGRLAEAPAVRRRRPGRNSRCCPRSSTRTF